MMVRPAASTGSSNPEPPSYHELLRYARTHNGTEGTAVVSNQEQLCVLCASAVDEPLLLILVQPLERAEEGWERTGDVQLHQCVGRRQ